MFKSKLAYTREIFNEATCLLTNYILLCFTNDYLPDYEMRNSLGTNMITLTMSNLAINLLFILIFAK